MKSYIMYKNQMQGVKDVSETVKAVEKIAASSVHFLKQEVSNLNAYAAEIEKVLARLSLFYQKKNHPLLQKRTAGKKAFIVLTGDSGLVGGLWHGIVNTALENVKQHQSVIVIGARGENYLKEEKMEITERFSGFSGMPKHEEVRRIADYIFDSFKKGALSQVDILYPRFVSLAEQKPVFIKFLPFEFDVLKNNNVNAQNVSGLPIFEPSKKEFFDRLLKKYIGIFFYKIIMETKLSELSARTAAMEHAAAKTDGIIQKLALGYAKERRRVITQRQLESFTAHKMI